MVAGRPILSNSTVGHRSPKMDSRRLKTALHSETSKIMSHSHLYMNISREQWPIVYRKEYNVHFLGLERLHPFDGGKWGNIFKILKENGLITKKSVVVPNEVKKDDLMIVHTKKYLKSLKCSFTVAAIAEVAPLILVPNYLVQRAYLRPMRYQTGGSILAGKLALDRGWSINIGGGFHHCSANKGGGFCVYADISLLIRFLLNNFPKQVQKILIVDLDAHQGNGYETDFKDNQNIYIMDVYNKWIYPRDHEAKHSIRKNVPLDFFTEDDEYLQLVKRALLESFQEFEPQLVVYNAGTDILAGDQLGKLSITEFGIIKRDEIVFTHAILRKCPIVMLTSGGYLKKTAKIIAHSILNLYEIGLINKAQEFYV